MPEAPGDRDWPVLVQVREAGERRAQQDVARDAQTVALTGRRLLEAQCDWLARREAGLQHRQGQQRSAAGGGASVAALRQAAHWDRVLQQRVGQAGEAVQAATALNEQADRLLAASRAGLRQASARLEQARHVAAETRRAQARVRDQRQDEQADVAALQRVTSCRRA